MNGIFFDEATVACEDLGYYRELHDYVKAKGGTALVVLNPGITTRECFMAAADIVVTFEHSYDEYVKWKPGRWESAYHAEPVLAPDRQHQPGEPRRCHRTVEEAEHRLGVRDPRR